MKSLFTFSVLFFCFACAKSPVVLTRTIPQEESKLGVRLPAQEEVNLCQEIEEELLVTEVDYVGLEKNFANVKEHVFKTNCAACHFGQDAYPPQLDNYESTLGYVDVRNPSQSRLLQAVETGRMPPSYRLGHRNSEGMSFFKAWILEGAGR